MSSYARANVRMTIEKNKKEIPMRALSGLKWENKMYKLRRSIRKNNEQNQVFQSLQEWAPAANHCFNENRWLKTWFQSLLFTVFREIGARRPDLMITDK